MPRVRHLRDLLSLAVVTIAVFGVGSVPASAVLISVVVDEDGHGSISQGASGASALPAGFLADPGPGGGPKVLGYDLAFLTGVVEGDVVLLESDGEISDLLRFGNSVLFFYSDRDGGGDALADNLLGLPTGRNPNLITLPEVPLGQGLVGATYTPTSGQPGFFPIFENVIVTYTFISDRIPEPASLFLLLSGGALMLAMGVLRVRAAKAVAPLRAVSHCEE